MPAGVAIIKDQPHTPTVHRHQAFSHLCQAGMVMMRGLMRGLGDIQFIAGWPVREQVQPAHQSRADQVGRKRGIFMLGQIDDNAAGPAQRMPLTRIRVPGMQQNRSPRTSSDKGDRSQQNPDLRR